METNFTFYMDLAKSEGSDDDNRVVRGLASCEEMDGQGEVVLQKGMDCEPALACGWINWDHMPGPENLIGVPTKLEIAEIQNHPIMRKSGLKGLGCYAEGVLLKGHPRAEAVWSLLKSSNNEGRSLAWSIQGSVLDRRGERNHVLANTAIRHLAITHQPVQTRSFAEMAKSLAKSLSIGQAPALGLEQIDYGPTSTKHLKKVLFGDCYDSHYNRNGDFRRGTEGMLEHLTLCKGLSLEDSTKFVKKLISSKVALRRILND